MNFRRYYLPNAIVFITQVVQDRAPVFRNPAHIELLLSILRRVQTLHPFAMLAYTFMPDHFHLLIRPTGNSNFSQIMHSLKVNFTRAYKSELEIDGSMKFWQKRFWEHTIRDENDLERHMDYIHYNPVKHGLVQRPQDWVYSSFRSWRERGAYDEGWGESEPDSISVLNWLKME